MRSRKLFNGVAGNMLNMAVSALLGFLAVFVCAVIFSFVMTKIDVDNSVLSVLTSAGLCVGAYVGGYAAARRRRKSGLLMGILCGLFIFLIIFGVSYFFAGTAGGFSASAKLVMTLICAGVGGIVGVNGNGRHFRLK